MGRRPCAAVHVQLSREGQLLSDYLHPRTRCAMPHTDYATFQATAHHVRTPWARAAAGANGRAGSSGGSDVLGESTEPPSLSVRRPGPVLLAWVRRQNGEQRRQRVQQQHVFPAHAVARGCLVQVLPGKTALAAVHVLLCKRSPMLQAPCPSFIPRP